jgi:hypothetical protein
MNRKITAIAALGLGLCASLYGFSFSGLQSRIGSMGSSFKQAAKNAQNAAAQQHQTSVSTTGFTGATRAGTKRLEQPTFAKRSQTPKVGETFCGMTVEGVWMSAVEANEGLAKKGIRLSGGGPGVFSGVAGQTHTNIPGRRILFSIQDGALRYMLCQVQSLGKVHLPTLIDAIARTEWGKQCIFPRQSLIDLAKRSALLAA